MSNVDVVRNYFACLFADRVRADNARELLTTSFKLIDPRSYLNASSGR